MNLQPIGVSNRLFYYLCGGEHSAFDICFRFDFKEEIDAELLQASAAKALQNFPEFAIRPVIHEGTVWAMANDVPVPLLSADDRILCYGTEDTGGYLFVFRLFRHGFFFSYFHGMTDFHGAWGFMRTVLYYYALAKGVDVQADEFVCLAPDSTMDESERLDPYRKFMEESKESVFPAALAISEKSYPPEEPKCSGYEIRCSLKDVLAAAKAQKTSVAAWISLVAARTIDDLYHAGEKPIVAMVSADMRKYYHTATEVNFSDAVFLRYDGKLKELPPEEQGAVLKEQLREQMSREHFAPLIARKTTRVDEVCHSGPDIVQWNQRIAGAGQQEKNSITFSLTYPGSLDLPMEYRFLVGEITRLICVHGPGLGNFGISASSYGDTMYIRSCQRFDSPAIMRGIREELAKNGLAATFLELPAYRGNQMMTGKLMHV